MRCKICGSTNVNIDTQQTSKYSWRKGFLGSLIFGAPGAVAGVGGKTETHTRYHCMACGEIGEYSWVVMNAETEWEINNALNHNNVAKLQSFKRRYRNIEWTPPVNPVPMYSTPIAPQESAPLNNATKPNLPPEKFEIDNGVLKKYSGSEAKVTIPQGVVTIGNAAFDGCKNLTSITIPNSVTSIDSSAFYGCKNLTSITIPSSVTSIGASAFADCKKLTSITIPKSVSSIGNRIFVDCDNLEMISVEEGNPNYRSEGNCLIRIEDSTVISGFANSKIPNYITSIGKEAISGFFLASPLVIPKNIIRIEDRAYFPYGVTSIIIPEKVNFIGKNAITDGFSDFLLETVTFSDPHGWVLLTDGDDEGKPIDDEILSDPKSAAEFIRDHHNDSFRKK